MLSLALQRYYEPLRLPRRPGAISVLTLYPPVGGSGPPPPRISRPALFLFRCMPPLLPREIRWNASVLSFHRQRPSPSDHRVGLSNQVTRLRLGSLALRPATLPLGNSQPPIARTLLPGARKVYGQLLSRDLNPQEKQPMTAYGQVSNHSWQVGHGFCARRSVGLVTTNARANQPPAETEPRKRRATLRSCPTYRCREKDRPLPKETGSGNDVEQRHATARLGCQLFASGVRPEHSQLDLGGDDETACPRSHVLR